MKQLIEMILVKQVLQTLEKKMILYKDQPTSHTFETLPYLAVHCWDIWTA